MRVCAFEFIQMAAFRAFPALAARRHIRPPIPCNARSTAQCPLISDIYEPLAALPDAFLLRRANPTNSY